MVFFAHRLEAASIGMIRRMQSMCKRGGKVSCGVPNYFSPDTIAIWLRYGKGSERRISRRHLLDLFKAAQLGDLKVLTSSSVFPWFIPIRIKRALNNAESVVGRSLRLGFLHIAIGTKAVRISPVKCKVDGVLDSSEVNADLISWCEPVGQFVETKTQSEYAADESYLRTSSRWDELASEQLLKLAQSI